MSVDQRSSFLRAMSIACLLVARANGRAGGIYGVYRESSFGLPDPIAPGSNVLIFSGDLPIGPAILRIADGFPLATSSAGVSVKITISTRSGHASATT